MISANLFRSPILLFIILFIPNLIISQDNVCLNFNGLADQVTIPEQVSGAIGSNDFTLEAYINGLEDENTNSTILSNRASTNSGFQLFIHTYWGGSEHKMLSLRYNSINWLLIDNGNFDGKVLDGNCHHVAVTQSNGLISFYVDGLLIGTRGGGNTPNLNMDTGAPILIGNDGLSGDAFDGVINDVRIWNVARSESEILDGFNNGVNPNEDGLLGYWGLSEGAGQNIADLSNNNDAFLGEDDSIDFSDPDWIGNCCVSSPPEFGMCLNFDGQNDYVTIPNEVAQSMGSNDFTLEAYINGLEDENTNSTILSNRASTNSGFQLFIHTYWGGSEHKMLSLRYNSINWLLIDNGNFDGKVLDGNCHHVAVTQSNGLISFYVDGLLIGTRGGGNTPNLNMDTGAPILIGNDGLSGDAFNGTIDNVKIWKVARSQTEIQDGIDNGVDPNESDLLGYWTMQEGSGQVVVDLTNQNDGVLGTQTAAESSDPTWGSLCCGPDVIIDVQELGDYVDQISVFPNPSNGIINIDFNTPFIANKYEFTIYDNLGRVVIKNTLSSPSLNLSQFNSGQYWLKISNGPEVIGLSKLSIIK